MRLTFILAALFLLAGCQTTRGVSEGTGNEVLAAPTEKLHYTVSYNLDEYGRVSNPTIIPRYTRLVSDNSKIVSDRSIPASHWKAVKEEMVKISVTEQDIEECSPYAILKSTLDKKNRTALARGELKIYDCEITVGTGDKDRHLAVLIYDPMRPGKFIDHQIETRNNIIEMRQSLPN